MFIEDFKIGATPGFTITHNALQTLHRILFFFTFQGGKAVLSPLFAIFVFVLTLNVAHKSLRAALISIVQSRPLL